MRHSMTTTACTYKGLSIQQFYPQGSYASILERIYKLFSYSLSKHSQVLLTGICVTYPKEYIAQPCNTQFTTFLENYRRQLWESKFDPLFLWCREQSNIETSVNQHYHIFLLLNGNRIRRFEGLDKLSVLWNMHLGIPLDRRGYIHITELGAYKKGLMMRRGDIDSIQQGFHAASYLSKVHTKDNTPKGIRKYDGSQLPYIDHSTLNTYM